MKRSDLISVTQRGQELLLLPDVAGTPPRASAGLRHSGRSGGSYAQRRKENRLPIAGAMAADGMINVIIETPRGSRNKFKLDEQMQCYRLGSVLPAGLAFPYDFGFVPGTKAEDGDPLDVLLLMDEPAFPGCLVSARLIGALEAEQTEIDGRTFRNDRLIAVAEDAHDYRDIRRVRDINANLLKELERFFIDYNETRGKKFRLLEIRGPKGALKLLKQSLLPNRKPRRKTHA